MLNLQTAVSAISPLTPPPFTFPRNNECQGREGESKLALPVVSLCRRH